MGSFTGDTPTPFSEPRGWVACPVCREREATSWRRYVRGEAPQDPFAPCPACGQPPRCTVREGRPDRCPRPATGEEAEGYLDYLAHKSGPMDADGGEGAYAALVDAWSRCVQERRRAEDLMKLHSRWSERPVGGAEEPEPVIVPKGRG